MTNHDQSNKSHAETDTYQRWLIRRPDKLVQDAPAQSEGHKARQAIQGLMGKHPG